MPDQPILSDIPTGERRSPTPRHSGASGLPILSTGPLTAAERDALRTAARTLRVIADRLDDARLADRVTHALQAVNLGVEAGIALAMIAAGLGSQR